MTDADLAARGARATAWAGMLLFIVSAFPYLHTSPFNTDVQPTAALVATLILLCTSAKAKLPAEIWVLGGILLMVMADTLFLEPTGNSFRAAFTYLSLFVVPGATYVLYRHGFRIEYKHVLWVVAIWFGVGSLQMVFGREFLTFLVTLPRVTTETRGMDGLAPEPSYYSTTILFFLMILFIMRRERSLAGLLCAIQLIAFSRSGMGILLLAVALGLIALRRMRLREIALLSIAIGLVIAIASYMPHSRIERLLLFVWKNPALLFLSDASGNQRIGQIYFSMKGAIDDYFVPHGFNYWLQYQAVASAPLKTLFFYFHGNYRPGSAYGAVIFEMGWFGLLIPLIYQLALLRMTSWYRIFILSVTLQFLLLMAVSLATPLALVILGMLLAGAGQMPDEKSPARELRFTPPLVPAPA